MATPVALFDYDLPAEFIAQTPVEPRDSSKLLVLDKLTGEIRHRIFRDIVEELRAGDVLVFNTSKVFKARLTSGNVEVFVLRIHEGEIEALIRPGKKFPVGSEITIAGRIFVVREKSEDGVVMLETGLSAAEMLSFCEAYGSVPLPPYIENTADMTDRYQTVYAERVGSVAAPTAGLHFTPELITKLKEKGVICVDVVLHVGLGTFRPVQSEHIEDHVMHEEWVEVTEATVRAIAEARRRGSRVIAVGTTSARALEGVAQTQGELRPFVGNVNIFITPGFVFQIIDGLITNFHLPKSTLLMLVSALSGREHVLVAYNEAKKQDYRFFSFGDAMLIE